MRELRTIGTARCCPTLADEAQLGWEAAAYLALEAMQDNHIRTRRTRAQPRTRR